MEVGILRAEREKNEMGVLQSIKSNDHIKKLYDDMRGLYFSVLTLISPELNTRARYKSVYGTVLDLDSPRTFSEKLLWLKLKDYISNPLVIQCADKYRVRKYIEDCGCGDILNELYGVYDSAQDIPWGDLPESFVLKWNFGAGMNIVVKEKSRLDVSETVQKLEKWGKVKYWLPHSEMQYKKTEKKLVCEKFLVDNANPDVIPDYKVYCFHGEPKAIFVMHDRGHGIKSEFFDTNWRVLKNSGKYAKPQQTTPKPACFEQMLEVSRKLSSPFPFVRCDYYVVNGKLIFGELTFTPAGGLYTSTTKIDGKDMSEFLHVPFVNR